MEKIDNKYLALLTSSPEKTTSIVKKVKNASAKKEVDACVALVVMMCCGIGVEKNTAQALSYCETIGRDFSLFQPSEALGLIFHYGLYGAKIDKNRAEDLLRQAALNGLKISAKILASYYISGEYFKKDIAEAVRWYEVAASQGDSEAMALMGEILLNGGTGVFGDIVKKEPIKGLEYLRKSAELGFQNAQQILLKHHLREAETLAKQISSNNPEMVDIRTCLDNIKWVIR